MADATSTSGETKSVDRGALYYPYIHIRDDEWLKATLLCFPFLDRMVPTEYATHDGEVAAFFAGTKGRLEQPMLGRRSLDDPFTEHARSVLLDKIRADVETQGLAARYSREMAKAQPGGADGFQIHEYKMKGALIDYLKSAGLAWEPSVPERGGARWWAVHGGLGEANMSTNAVALAKKRGLEIVTASGPVHEALLGTEPEEVYDALIGHTLPGARTDSRKVNDVLRFVIMTEFDLSKLSLEQIVELNRQRADLASLKAELLDAVADFGEQPDREMWNDALAARARDVVGEWAARDSFAQAIRHLDASELKDEAKDFLKTTLPGVGGGAITASVVGSLPGLVVGAVFAGVSLWQGWRGYQRPYRFLSRLSSAPGVRRRHVLELSTA